MGNDKPLSKATLVSVIMLNAIAPMFHLFLFSNNDFLTKNFLIFN
jgi:hypothetical protein